MRQKTFTVEEALKELDEDLSPTNPLVLVEYWTDDDIREQASLAFDVDDLTDEEVKLIMSMIKERFDANTGINWFEITEAIRDALPNRANKQE